MHDSRLEGGDGTSSISMAPGPGSEPGTNING